MRMPSHKSWSSNDGDGINIEFSSITINIRVIMMKDRNLHFSLL